jgi:protein-L-isoaspartate(D-aspartate) O-methyltransferase
LIEVLRERGVIDAEVLRAFAEVPRHRFVERFWTVPVDPGAGTGDVRLVVVGQDEDALEELYHPDRALITAGLRGPNTGTGSIEQQTVTSSLSAPYLVALMLLELDLAPGMRVLEIGAGSGYHAALMAALVGDPERVTTIEIDPVIAAEARRNLDGLGLGGIAVITGDGSAGFPAGAPYDRVVATVGCADLAPAWVDQLGPDGRLLVPLVHGGTHPRVLVSPASTGAAGGFVGHSGFVSIQGDQAGGSPWPGARPRSAPGASARSSPLPRALVAALRRADGSDAHWSPGLGLYLALRDHRAGIGHLVDGSAVAEIRGDQLVVDGGADEMGARLVALAEDWLALGAPGLDRYRTVFVHRPTSEPRLVEPTTPAGPWVVERLRYRQTITLTGRS